MIYDVKLKCFHARINVLKHTYSKLNCIQIISYTNKVLVGFKRFWLYDIITIYIMLSMSVSTSRSDVTNCVVKCSKVIYLLSFILHVIYNCMWQSAGTYMWPSQQKGTKLAQITPYHKIIHILSFVYNIHFL